MHCAVLYTRTASKYQISYFSSTMFLHLDLGFKFGLNLVDFDDNFLRLKLIFWITVHLLWKLTVFRQCFSFGCSLLLLLEPLTSPGLVLIHYGPMGKLQSCIGAQYLNNTTTTSDNAATHYSFCDTIKNENSLPFRVKVEFQHFTYLAEMQLATIF